MDNRFYPLLYTLVVLPLLCANLLFNHVALAQVIYPGVIATTTVTISICGNEIVDAGEQCDVLGETGTYSTTIAGRQCNASCNFGPYCGDGILQTTYSEECDDGNNDNGDFCSATCTVEPAGSGGGGASGGGPGAGGGATTNLGNTRISVTGRAYPSQTVHILIDSKEVGSVKADAAGKFEFTTDSSPGTVSMGFWANDVTNTRSVTLSTTFDVTQGAITNINGILLPPTLRLSKTNVNPGESITISGHAVPNAEVEVHFDASKTVEKITADGTGAWTLPFNTNKLSTAAHTVRARYLVGGGSLKTQSSFSTTLQLFNGVDGVATRPADLNRDGSVNLIDFSILIFWWGTNGGQSDPPADINANSKVGLEDFSILLFNWTG